MNSVNGISVGSVQSFMMPDTCTCRVVENQEPADRLVRRDIAEVFSDRRHCQDDFVGRRQRRGRITGQPAVLEDAEIPGVRDNRGRQRGPRDVIVKLAMWIVAAGYRNLCRIQHIGRQRLHARQLTGGQRAPDRGVNSRAAGGRETRGWRVSRPPGRSGCRRDGRRPC